MSTAHVIRAQGVVKRFGDFTAVDGVSFAVNEGEFFGLLGPNGAGKTSMIRMIAGVSPMNEGGIEVFGQDIRTHWRQIRRRVGVCQQENTLDTDLTVLQNLEVFGRYFELDRATTRQRGDELLDFFALTGKRDHRVMQLSGGMARRLQLARALINEPGLIILDEPTTGLDPQSRHQVWDRLEALKRRGLCLLLTTHYMEEAASLCDRLVIVDHGTLLVEGAPADLIAQHAGSQVVEIDQPDEAVRAFLMEQDIAHDDLEWKCIAYTDRDAGLERTLLERFQGLGMTFRPGTLEDVFLRLTGRELRE